MKSIGQGKLGTVPPLTKVWNRLHAIDRLANEIKRAARETRYQFSILLIQFDGLGRLTHRLGHAPADDVCQRVTKALVDDLRAGEMCGRLGDDEFLLILPSLGERECRGLVERLHQRWMPAIGTREATIQLNIGAASYPDAGSTSEGLLATADAAMDVDRQRRDQTRVLTGLSSDPALAA